MAESVSVFGLTSFFSNIGTDYFVSRENDPDENRFSVTVPPYRQREPAGGFSRPVQGCSIIIYGLVVGEAGDDGFQDDCFDEAEDRLELDGLGDSPANTFQKDSGFDTASSVTDPTSGSVLKVIKTAASTWSWTLTYLPGNSPPTTAATRCRSTPSRLR